MDKTNIKILFLIFHGFNEANGISKKIRYQVKALRACGTDTRLCYYDIAPDGHRLWKAEEQVIADLGTGKMAKIKKRISFHPICEYARREGIDIVYIRSYHNANPFTIKMVKQLKRQGTKVIMEIPTYPYDQEYITFRMKLELMVDKCFRNSLARHLDAIVTFSDACNIFGADTIRISNGVDFDAIPLKKQFNNNPSELHLIGVAEVHYWHGYDRLIHGLAEYYRTNPDFKVYFHLVGDLNRQLERQDILPAIRENKLENYGIMHGARHGKDLEEIFELSDFGIGSLARHRSGIDKIKTLKNREYAARGLAFTYSETDEDFDRQPYVLKVPADESPIDIKQIVKFYRSLSVSPEQIRGSILDLSWTNQMLKVIQTATSDHLINYKN